MPIYVDADACPVKDEVYRVAGRYGLKTWVVANGWMRVPESPLVERVTVTEGLDQADDWIVEHAGPGDVVVTADIPLADRCVKRGARVLAPTGRPFTEASIGNDLATRNLLTELRDTGQIRGGGRRRGGRDHRRYPARRPLPEGGRRRDRPQRPAVHRELDRRCRRHPRDHGRPARRRGFYRHADRRAAALRQDRPLALPLGARRSFGASAAAIAKACTFTPILQGAACCAHLGAANLNGYWVPANCPGIVRCREC